MKETNMTKKKVTNGKTNQTNPKDKTNLKKKKDLTLIINEKGTMIQQTEIIQTNMISLTNIITNMIMKVINHNKTGNIRRKRNFEHRVGKIEVKITSLNLELNKPEMH